MHAKNSELRRLASRIHDGDSSATDAFLRELEPQLTRIIRSVMRTGIVESVIARRIIGEIDRMNLVERLDDDPKWLAKKISRRICQMAVEGLQSGADVGRSHFETILNCWGIETTHAC
jgi:hypothetical protein